jgi:hypothetical protein
LSGISITPSGKDYNCFSPYCLYTWISLAEAAA